MEKMQLSHFWVMTLTRRYVCQSVCRRRLKVPKVLKNDWLLMLSREFPTRWELNMKRVEVGQKCPSVKRCSVEVALLGRSARWMDWTNLIRSWNSNFSLTKRNWSLGSVVTQMKSARKQRLVSTRARMWSCPSMNLTSSCKLTESSMCLPMRCLSVSVGMRTRTPIVDTTEDTIQMNWKTSKKFCLFQRLSTSMI